MADSDQPTDVDALGKLKDILLDQEKERITRLEEEIDALAEQLHDKEQLIESLDPIIADLLYQKIMESRNQMAEALAPVMGSAIRKQIETAKEDIADALHPVIGKAVRKSVSEAMKNLLKTINERIDNVVSTSLRLGRKVDSKTLLKESLPFQLREIFLVHKETGILLAHTSYENKRNVNEDIISGMLTAIKDFSKTAFSSNDQSLNEIQYENLNIFIEDGKYAYLAFVTEGVPGEAFKNIIKELENKIHLRFYKKMREFDGDTAEYAPVKETFRSFIDTVHKPFFNEVFKKQSQKRKPLGLLYLAVFLAVIISGYFVFFHGVEYRAADEILTKYSDRDGALFSHRFKNDEVYLRGVLPAADKNDMISELLQFGYEVNTNALYDRPSQNELEDYLLQTRTKINTPALNVNVMLDSARVILVGSVSDQSTRLLFANYFAEISRLPFILNNISIGSSADSIAVVIKVVGTTSILRYKSNESDVPVRGSYLFNRDKITTSGKSLIFIKFIDDNSLLRIRPNSTLILNAKEQSGSFSKKIELAAGAFFSEITQQSRNFSVVTPTSVASVKGTRFWSEHSLNGTTRYIAIDGTAVIKNNVGEVTLNAGETASVQSSESAISVIPTQESDIPLFGLESVKSSVIYFEPGSAQLNDPAERKLVKIIEILSIEPFNKLLIHGYADSVGTVLLNDSLSAQRAKMVEQYLVNGGIAENKIDIAFHGARDPERGKTYLNNRRVVFEINEEK